MMRPSIVHWILSGAGLLVWAALIFLPLGCLYGSLAVAWPPADTLWSTGGFAALVGRSCALAALLALAAVVLGFVPGYLLASSRRHETFLFWLLLAPLLLPSYVLYYLWSLLLNPTAALGRLLAGQSMEVVSAVGTLTSSLVEVLWYWPLAALLMAQGWRTIDAEVWQNARLDANPRQRLFRVTLPLLARPMALALAVCFVLLLCDSDTFHLAGVTTLGTELGVLYEATGSSAAVARATLPLAPLALVVALVLTRSFSRSSAAPAAGIADDAAGVRSWHWAVLGILVVVSIGVPLGLLLANLNSLTPLGQFWQLQQDGLKLSAAAAGLSAGLALAMAAGTLALAQLGKIGRRVSSFVQATMLLAVFLPGTLVGAAILRSQFFLHWPMAWSQSWWVIAAGQAARFAGVALLMLLLARDSLARQYHEMAGVDGAGTVKAWWHVHLPLVWPAVAGAAVVVAMFSLTELAATMVLLPAGVPNFTQRLLNQMHYARDQHVIVSCLLLVLVFLALAALVAVMRGLGSVRRWSGLGVVACAAALSLAGCDGDSSTQSEPTVCWTFGGQGPGPGEFLYPRTIDFDASGNVYVGDKTGRIQHLTDHGEVLGTIHLPAFQAGNPTGLSLGPDGNLYVADTHYHRVLVYDRDGRIVRQFGEFGEGPGQFIYPTDVAFAPDGRIFVSEYGGHDRVSIYSPEGKFLSSFGRQGNGEGEFSRPQSLAVDPQRRLLYVTDACNHRIAKYTLDGHLLGYIGSVGQAPGQLRYPYGLAVLPQGDLVVCEYGNNRVQVLDPAGRSLRCLGGPGRGLGELAFPWGLAVDAKRRAFIVDAGNNRIQVWQLK
jgi:ABC-type Fe3+ transport system permease subunit/DNA-binding beta-propeller fold protein YncE